jgi:hypothetical protein
MPVVVNYPPPSSVVVNEVTGAVTVVAAGPRGVQGVPGVVTATAPLTYDSGTQTVALDESGIEIAPSQVTGLINALTIRTSPVQLGETTYKTIPGNTFLRGNTGNLGFVAFRVYYYPWLVSAPMTLTDLEVVITTGQAGINGVAVLYGATDKWQPTGNAVASSGAIDISTTGVKTATLATPVTLSIGRYVLLVARSPQTGSNPVARSCEAGLPSAVVTASGAISTAFVRWRGDATLAENLFTSPPTNPSGFTSVDVFGSNADSHIFVGVFSA